MFYGSIKSHVGVKRAMLKGLRAMANKSDIEETTTILPNT